MQANNITPSSSSIHFDSLVSKMKLLKQPHQHTKQGVCCQDKCSTRAALHHIGHGSLPEGWELCGYPEPNPAWVCSSILPMTRGVFVLPSAWGVRAALRTGVLLPPEGSGTADILCLTGTLPGKGRGKLREGFFLFLSLKRPRDSEAVWVGQNGGRSEGDLTHHKVELQFSLFRMSCKQGCQGSRT